MTLSDLLRHCGALASRAAMVIAVFVTLGAPVSAVAQTPFDSTFDHFTTGWPLEGAHRNADCGRCHVGGIFQGTSRECGDCHALAGLVQATPLPPDHVRLNSTQCQDCHFNTSWSPVSRVDHASLIGECSSCHNSIIATGKSPGHVQSGDNCDACHVTTAWLPAFFFHNNVVPGTCNECHVGDKNPGHLLTTESCDACHVTTAWLPAFFDHASVTPGSCNDCHSGDKDPGHLLTSESCDSCHVTTAWLPAFFDHAGVTPGSCNDCHSGDKDPGHLLTAASCDACHVTTGWLPAFFDHDGVAPGTCNTCHMDDQNNGHFMTTASCDDCHTTNAWAPDTFMHMSAAYPGDHAGNLDCVECHGGNSVAVTWPAPAYQPDCAACHVNDFRPGPHKVHENPDTFYSVSELRDCAGACHVYTDATRTTIKDFEPGPEHRVRSNEF